MAPDDSGAAPPRCAESGASQPAVALTSSRKSLRSERGPQAGVRGIPSPFIKIYERGRDTPHPGLWRSTTA
jgi:hypothetical protein